MAERDPSEELSLLRRRLGVVSRMLRGDAERACHGQYEEGFALGKLRGAEWIDAVLRGDFDAIEDLEDGDASKD